MQTLTRPRDNQVNPAQKAHFSAHYLPALPWGCTHKCNKDRIPPVFFNSSSTRYCQEHRFFFEFYRFFHFLGFFALFSFFIFSAFFAFWRRLTVSGRTVSPARAAPAISRATPATPRSAPATSRSAPATPRSASRSAWAFPRNTIHQRAARACSWKRTTRGFPHPSPGGNFIWL